MGNFFEDLKAEMFSIMLNVCISFKTVILGLLMALHYEKKILKSDLYTQKMLVSDFLH